MNDDEEGSGFPVVWIVILAFWLWSLCQVDQATQLRALW